MFFGADGGIQRYDDFRYPQFDKVESDHDGLLLETRRSSLQKDRADFMNHSDQNRNTYSHQI